MPRRRMCVDRAARGERRDRAAVAVGAEEQRILLRQQQLAGCRIDRRHRALAEQHHIILRQAEAFVLVQETPSARRASPGWSSCRSAPARRIAAQPRALSRNGFAAATRPTPARSDTSPWDGRTQAGSPALRRPAARRSCRPQALRSPRLRASAAEYRPPPLRSASRIAGGGSARRASAAQSLRRRLLLDTALQSARNRSPRSATPIAAGRPRPARPKTAASAPGRMRLRAGAAIKIAIRRAAVESIPARCSMLPLENPAPHPSVRQQAQQRKQHEYRAYVKIDVQTCRGQRAMDASRSVDVRSRFIDSNRPAALPGYEPTRDDPTRPT